MKNVKRVLSLILSLCMLCSCFAMAAVWAEEDAAVAEKEPTTSEAIAKLEALGIWSDGYVESAELSRGDLAVVLAGLLGFGNNEITSEPAFTDVQPGDNCYGAVMFLYGLGVFSPADDGLFHPEDKPTYEQLVKIMAELAGYGVMAKVNGGYPTGYLTAANRYDLLPSSFMRTPKDVYTLADIADVLAYLIDVPIMEQNSFGSEEAYYVNEDKTLLAVYHNLYLDEGVLTSVQGRKLYADVSANKKRITVDDRPYMIGDVIPAPELMGYAVKAYYKYDGRSVDDKTLVYIEQNVKRNKDYFIEGDLITGCSNGTVTYYKDENSAKPTSMELKSTMSILYNYNYANGYDDNDILNADRLVFIDSDNNGSYDVLNIVHYETIFVKSVDNTSYKVYDKYGAAALDLDLNNDYKTVDVYDGNNQRIEASAIPVKSVLSVIRDKGAEHITVYISNLTQKGRVETVKNSEDPKEITYTVEGETYELANNCGRVDFVGDVRVGDYVTLYLTREGKVGGLEKIKESGDYFYGYVSGSATESGPFEDIVKLLIYNDMGELLKLEVPSEVKVTDIGKVKSKDIIPMLRDNSSNPNSVKQLIKYKVDENNVIKEITLATRLSEDELITDNSSFNRFINLKASYNKEYRMFFGKLRLDENTKILLVPISEEYVQEIDHYDVRDIIDFSSGTYNVETYDVSADRTVGALVVRSDYGVGDEMKSNSATSVVKDVVSAINDEGDVTTRLDIIRGGQELSFYMADTCSTIQYYRGENGPVPCEIKKGDIIRFGTDSNGNISDWYKIFSANDEDRSSQIIRGYEQEDRKDYKGSNRTMLEFKGNAETPESDIISGRVWQGNDNQYNFPGVAFIAQAGIVEEKINSVMYVKTYGGTEGAEKNKNYLTYMKAGNIVVVDMQEDEVRKGTVEDIHAVKDDGLDDASRVVIVKYQEQSSLIVVIKR